MSDMSATKQIKLESKNATKGSMLQMVIETEPGVFTLAMYKVVAVDGDTATYEFVGYPTLDKSTGLFVL
jgi:hypothetical protein